MVAVADRRRVAHVVRVAREGSEPPALPAAAAPAASASSARELLLGGPRRDAKWVRVVIVRPTAVEIWVQGGPAELLAQARATVEARLHRSHVLLLHVFMRQPLALLLAQVSVVRHPPHAHGRVLGAGRVLVVPLVADDSAAAAALQHADGADVAAVCDSQNKHPKTTNKRR